MKPVQSAPITVVTPTIPPRCGFGNLLERAVLSVRSQTLQPSGGVSCSVDVDRAGAAITRQRALDAARTEWVAFLDDDDTWYEHHLQTLWDLAQEYEADYVWSWFDGNDPFPMHRGKQMDPANPHHTTMNVMVKRELAQAAGFVIAEGPMDANWFGEDWRFILRCIELGGKFRHTPTVTWTYRMHSSNTSGLPTRW